MYPNQMKEKMKVRARMDDRSNKIGTKLRIEEISEGTGDIFLGSDGNWHICYRYEPVEKEGKKC